MQTPYECKICTRRERTRCIDRRLCKGEPLHSGADRVNPPGHGTLVGRGIGHRGGTRGILPPSDHQGKAGGLNGDPNHLNFPPRKPATGETNGRSHHEPAASPSGRDRSEDAPSKTGRAPAASISRVLAEARVKSCSRSDPHPVVAVSDATPASSQDSPTSTRRGLPESPLVNRIPLFIEGSNGETNLPRRRRHRLASLSALIRTPGGRMLPILPALPTTR